MVYAKALYIYVIMRYVLLRRGFSVQLGISEMVKIFHKKSCSDIHTKTGLQSSRDKNQELDFNTRIF